VDTRRCFDQPSEEDQPHWRPVAAVEMFAEMVCEQLAETRTQLGLLE